VRTYAVVLAFLAVAFLGRVLGQVVVALFGPPFLPPMQEWYSGVIPYSVLLPVQILILAFQALLSRQLWVGRGALTLERPTLGIGLKWFSLIYFLAMAARYVISMVMFPERRWFGHAIPIFFHFVLAAYIYMMSRYYRSLTIGRQGETSSV
jgi:hypothetical protein